MLNFDDAVAEAMSRFNIPNQEVGQVPDGLSLQEMMEQAMIRRVRGSVVATVHVSQELYDYLESTLTQKVERSLLPSGDTFANVPLVVESDWSGFQWEARDQDGNALDLPLDD